MTRLCLWVALRPPLTSPLVSHNLPFSPNIKFNFDFFSYCLCSVIFTLRKSGSPTFCKILLLICLTDLCAEFRRMKMLSSISRFVTVGVGRFHYEIALCTIYCLICSNKFYNIDTTVSSTNGWFTLTVKNSPNIVRLKFQITVNFTLQQAISTQIKSRDTAIQLYSYTAIQLYSYTAIQLYSFYTLGSRWGYVVNAMPKPL